MAVDRGQLRYSIRLTTGQTFRNLRNFAKGLKESRQAFQAFRRELRAGGRDATVAARGIGRVGAALKSVGADRTSQQALAQQIIDARKARKAFGRIVSELVQIKRSLRGVRKESIRTGRSLQRTGQKAAIAGKRGAASFRRLRSEVVATRGSADRLASSFLRMGGIISTFIVARGILDGMRGLIETSIRFNRTIERSELGIAAILSAVGQVRGAFGEVVGQAQQLSLAQAEARRQTQLLRKDALKTAATFEQLLDTLQVALAPGLTAGLDVDEVRGFAIRISQAALALGLAQNQLSEEIRSILSGTIRPQTTRIAVALGITNEDIARVRELGQLGEFLQDRFAAFGAAGEKALDTIDGLIGRVLDGFSQLSGEAGKSVGFFDNVKNSLRNLLDLFLDFDEFGFPTPDPKTLKVLQVFFEAIQEGFTALQEELGDITFEDAIKSTKLLADAIVAGIQIAIGVIQGLASAFRTLGELIRGVANALGFDAASTGVRALTRGLVTVITLAITLRAGLGLIVGIISPITGAVTALVKAFRFIGPLLLRLLPSMATLRVLVLTTVLQVGRLKIAFSLLPAPIQASAVAMGNLAASVLKVSAVATGLLFGLREVIRFFTGIALDLDEFILTLAASFERLGLTLAKTFRTIGASVFNFIAGFFNRFAQQVLQPVVSALADLAGRVVVLGNALGVLGDKTADAIQQAVTGLQVRRISVQLIDVGGIEKEFRDAFEQNDALFAEIERRNRERTAKDKTESDKRDAINDKSAKGIINNLKLEEEAAESLIETLTRISASFSTARTAIGTTQEAVNRLRDSLQTLNLQEEFTLDPRVTGLAGRINILQQKEQVQLAIELKRIAGEQLSLEQVLVRVRKNSENSQKALTSFSAQEQAIILSIDQGLVRGIQLRREEESLITKAAVASAVERKAIEQGATQEANAARQRRTGLEAQIEAVQKQRIAIEKSINLIQEQNLLNDKALQFTIQRLAALSREASLEADLALIKTKIRDLEAQSLEFQRLRAETLAQKGIQQAQQQAAQLQIQARLLQDINLLETTGAAAGAAVRLRTFQAQSAELRIQTSLQRETQLRNAQSLQQDIIKLGALGGTTTALKTQLELLLAQINAQKLLSAAEEERRQREEERLRILSEGTAGEAIGVGVEDFIQAIGTVQEQLAALTTQLLQTLSSGISNAIVSALVNAFDESASFSTEKFLDGLELAAGQLLQSIGQQILQTVVDNIVSSVLSAIIGGTAITTTAATTAAAITTAAAATAGTTRVTSATIAANIEIAAAQTAAAIKAASAGISGGISTGGLIPAHFDGGGTVPGGSRFTSRPPAGVSRSDTVAAYLTPGEFVQRVSAVRHYGVDVMRALNRRLIDPGLLQSLAGVKNMRSFHTQSSRGPGFQTGDLVTDNIRQVATNLENQIGERIVDSTLPAVAVPMSENTFETQLAAGGEAMRRWLRDNAHDVDGILRSGRTGG